MYVVSLSTPVSPAQVGPDRSPTPPTPCLLSPVQDGTVVDKRPVPKHQCSLDFLDLVPGHAYMLTVQSLSGKLTNESTGAGRTGRWVDSWVQIPAGS